MDPLSEEDVDVAETSSTSTLSVGPGDASTTAEEDESSEEIRSLTPLQGPNSSNQVAESSPQNVDINSEVEDQDGGSESLSVISLDDFQRNFDLLDAAVTDPFVERAKVDIYLTWLPWIESGKATKAHIRLFYDDLLPRTIKLILQRRYDPSRAEMVNVLLLTLAKRVLGRINGTAISEIPNSVAETIMNITNPYCHFYLMHGHEEPDAQSVSMSSAPANDNYCGTLTVAETDALKVGDTVHLMDDKVSGRIIEQSPTETEVCIELESTKAHKWFPKEASLFATERFDPIAHLKVSRVDEDKVLDEERLKAEPTRFRSELQPGTFCDARNCGMWFQACIIQLLPEDNVLVHFLGFSTGLNQTMPRMSADLAPLNSKSKGRRGTGYISPEFVDQEELEASASIAEVPSANDTRLKHVRSRSAYPASRFFLSNMEALIHEGLMNMIYHAMESNLKLSFITLSQMVPHLTESYVRQLLPDISNRTRDCISKLKADQVRNLSKPLASRIVSTLYRLSRRVNGRSQAAQHAEIVRLELIRKRLESETIVQRVNGLTSLNEVIEESCNWKRAPWGIELHGDSPENMYYTMVKITLNIVPENLAKWCEEKHFLQNIFSRSTAHVELVKRSSKLIALLCEEGLFTSAEFEIVWQASRSDDQEVAAAAIGVLGFTCQFFPVEVRSLFKSKLHELDLKKPSVLELLKDLVTQASPDVSQAVCDILWQEAMEGDSQPACQALEAGLRKPHTGEGWELDLRKKIIIKCVEDDRLRHIASLKILRAAVESCPVAPEEIVTLPSDSAEIPQEAEGPADAPTAASTAASTAEAKGSIMSREAIVAWLCNDLKIISTLLDSFVLTETDTEEVVTVTRLEFLSFILFNSRVAVVDRETIDLLWDKFPLGSKSRDAFFTWLQKICRNATMVPESKKELRIDNDTLRSVFSRFEKNPEFKCITAFRVFQAFFLGVNLAENRIFMGDGGDGIRVCQESLIGQDILWRAALEASSSNTVAEAAASLIGILSQRLALSMSDRVWAVRFSVMERCRARLALALEEHSLVVLSRCCSLLRNIVRDAELDLGRMVRENPSLWDMIKPLSALGPYEYETSITVQNTVKGSPGFNSRFILRLRANDPVGKLRVLVASRCDIIDPLDIRLFVGATELPVRSDIKTLVSCMPIGPYVLACRRVGDKPVNLWTPSPTSASLTVSDLDRFDQCAETLLEGLEQMSVVSSSTADADADDDPKTWIVETWELLQSLPVNRRIQTASVDYVPSDIDVFEEDENNGNRTVDGRTEDSLDSSLSPFRLLCNLRLLEDNLSRFPTIQGRSLFIRSRNIFGRLQDLLLKRSELLDVGSDSLWNCLVIAQSQSLMLKLLKGSLPASEIPQATAVGNLVGASLPRDNKVISWPELQLELDAMTQEMVLATLNADDMQTAISTKMIRFFTTVVRSVETRSDDDDDDNTASTLEKSNSVLKTISNGDFVKTSFELWALLVDKDQDLFERHSKDVLDSLFWIVSNCDANICHGLLRLFSALPKLQILEIVMSTLPSENVHLLELCQRLLHRAIKQDIADVDDCKRFLKELRDKLRGLPSTEGMPFPSGEPYSDHEDLKVTGLFRLIRVLVPCCGPEYDPALMETVADCVLNLEKCKCERIRSREMAYDVLSSICDVSPSEADEYIAGRLMTCFKECFLMPLEGWHLDPCSDLRSPLGLSGLINLGCTCYINSLVQQLWNIPYIRNGFRRLNIRVPLPEASSQGRQGSNVGTTTRRSSVDRKKDDDLHLLYLLKMCMAQLSHSTRRACSLETFVRSFKDEFGNPTNVLEQQDAQEFFEKTCDRLDDAMDSQGNPRLFVSTLGVKLGSELVCLEDSTQPRRENQGSMEWALKIQLVPGGGTLEQSLQKFVSGEVLTDFRWTDGGPSLRTLQKTFVSSLSDTLPIHIKRFQMNWDTMVTEKMNDRLEFPLELDMFPYTKEGLDYFENLEGAADLPKNKYMIEGRSREYYMYRLVGVLVHSGASLNAGHYYSHILSRVPGATHGRWFTFNDTTVTEFKLKDLPEHTFGGSVKHATVDPETSHLHEVEHVVTHSAYMLFYERISGFNDTSLTGEGKSTEEQLSVDPIVERENADHLRMCRLFDPALLKFLLKRCTGQDSVVMMQHGPVEQEKRMAGRKKVHSAVTNVEEASILSRRSEPTNSDQLLSVVARQFLLGDAVAARDSLCTSLYPQLAEAVRRGMMAGPETLNTSRADSFLHMVTLDDVRHLLIETTDIRTRIAFSSLLGTAAGEASRPVSESFLQRLLLHPRLLEEIFADADNSYWFALRHVIDQHDYLALKAFDLGLLPELFNACLGNESPVFDWVRASPKQGRSVFRKRQPKSPSQDSPIATTIHSAYAKNGWDNAVVAAAITACVALDVMRMMGGDVEGRPAITTEDDASFECLKDLGSWVSLVGCITQPETVEKIYGVLMRGMMQQLETERGLCRRMARSASVASLASIPRYFDLVYQLSLDSPDIAVWFFLGEGDEVNIGFLRRVVTNRSSLFAFHCLMLFVERLDEFPVMKTATVVPQWLENVDAFLRDDELTSNLEPRDINRILLVLEVLAAIRDPTTGGSNVPLSAQSGSVADYDTGSTASPPGDGWNSDLYDDDEDVGSPTPKRERGQGLKRRFEEDMDE